MNELEFKKLRRRAALSVLDTLRSEINDHENLSLNWSNEAEKTAHSKDKANKSQWSLEEAFLASVKQTAIEAIEEAIVNDDLTSLE